MSAQRILGLKPVRRVDLFNHFKALRELGSERRKPVWPLYSLFIEFCGSESVVRKDPDLSITGEAIL